MEVMYGTDNGASSLSGGGIFSYSELPEQVQSELWGNARCIGCFLEQSVYLAIKLKDMLAA